MWRVRRAQGFGAWLLVRSAPGSLGTELVRPQPRAGSRRPEAGPAPEFPSPGRSRPEPWPLSSLSGFCPSAPDVVPELGAFSEQASSLNRAGPLP